MNRAVIADMDGGRGSTARQTATGLLVHLRTPCASAPISLTKHVYTHNIPTRIVRITLLYFSLPLHDVMYDALQRTFACNATLASQKPIGQCTSTGVALFMDMCAMHASRRATQRHSPSPCTAALPSQPHHFPCEHLRYILSFFSCTLFTTDIDRYGMV